MGGGKIHWLKSAYLLLMIFLTDGIQTLQHQSKKCMNCKGDYLEK